MIFRHKPTGIVVQDAIATTDIQGQHYVFAGSFKGTENIKLHLSKDESERLYTDSEIEDYISITKELKMKNEKLKNEINELEYKHRQIEIPQYLAEAIESFRKTFTNNTEKIISVIFKIFEMKKTIDNHNPTQEAFQIMIYLEQNKNGLLNIITAIMNGYTIKKEPKDILRESILDIIDSEDESEHQVDLIMELVDKFKESES